MTTKFPKSRISVQGKLWINIVEDDVDTTIGIDLNGLKRSKSGVYCLRNKLNGRLYIGKARNLEARKQRHTRDLRKGQHCSKLLQSDFYSSRYNLVWDLFEFEVIIYCRPSELTFYENLLITHLNPYYNTHKQRPLFGSNDVFSDDNL